MDDRVRVVPHNGYNWDTYSYLLENGDLDVDIAPWENCASLVPFEPRLPLTPR